MDDLRDLRQKLLAQQFLFDDPGAYRAGIFDAFDALLEVVDRSPAPEPGSGRRTLGLAPGFGAERDRGGEDLVGDAEGVDEAAGVGT